jgi:Spy/CpxP family protein refolding chaperone
MKKLLCLLLCLIVTGMVMSTRAQQNNAYGVGERLFPMVSRVLTTQQRQSLQQIIEGQRDQIRPLVDKLQTSRQAMLNQVIGSTFNENLVRQDAAQSASAEVDLTVIFARALSHMQPPLSAQQVAQIKNFSPGRLKEARKGQGGSGKESEAAPEVHLKLPAPLPQDTNGLPIVN